jgi:hypothetical protein
MGDSRDGHQTIVFAVQSGVTLAYFALYKDFAKASNILSKEQQAKDPKAERYIRYDQLALNWDQILTNVKVNHDHVVDSCDMSGGPVTKLELECYRKLSALGFQFTDLVKYNDFHDEEADGGSLLRAVTWNSHREYFKTVEQAYRKFYLRDSFVEEYNALLSHGY